MTLPSLLWYAAYGSNLLQSRFRCYIEGGRPTGADLSFPGCHDKTPPHRTGRFRLPYGLYFARQTPSWQSGGAAFVDTSRVDTLWSYARIYLITPAQFVDILKQENLSFDAKIEIDLERALAHGEIEEPQFSWYPRVIAVARHDNWPVLTFSAPRGAVPTYNRPSTPYLENIVHGLLEAYGLDAASIGAYLEKVPGVHGQISHEDLMDTIRRASALHRDSVESS